MLLSKTRNQIYNFFVGSTLVAVVSFSFFFSILSFYLGFTENDTAFSSYSRIFIFFLCIICFFISFQTGAFKTFLTKNSIFLLLIYIYYGIVIYHDLYLDYNSGVPFSDIERNSIIQRILRLVFMPMIALILFRRKSLDLVFWAKIISLLLFFSLIASLAVLELNIGETVDDQVQISKDLNSLNIGYSAATEVLLILFLLTKSGKTLKLLFLFVGLPFSIYVILITGSRGPLFYPIIIGLYYLLVIDDFNKYRRVIRFIILSVFVILFLNYTVIFGIISEYNSILVERIEDAIFYGNTSGRDRIYVTALNQFYDSPLFGDYFVLTSGEFKGSYPHNILIEALMSLGLVGAIPLFILMFKTFVRVRYILINNEDNAWIAIIFLISFLKGLSSWNLYGNELLWVSMFIILTYNVNELNKKSKKLYFSNHR